MGNDFSISPAGKQFLLQLARETIHNACEGKAPARKPFFCPEFEKKSGVFVTLHRQGELRGCIGYVQGISPLQHAVQEMAVSAAFNDPRFNSLEIDELDDLVIEISILTPLEIVNSVNEIVVGRDGLVIEKGSYRGLLLPQVASENGWDRDQFLDHTCIKAGLTSKAWKEPGARILRFQAIIFNEHDT